MADPTPKSPGEEKGRQLDTTQDHNMNVILKDQVPVFTVSSLVLKIGHFPKLAVRGAFWQKIRYVPLRYSVVPSTVPGLSLSTTSYAGNLI
jgi:hypothetical protein